MRPPMRPLLAAFLLLVPLTAGGCVDRLRALEPDAPTETVLPWGLSGCTFVIAVVPVQASALQDKLPEGFRALTPAEAGLPSDMQGDANLGVEAWRCAEGVGLNASAPLNDVAYGAVFSFVEPPADVAVNGSQLHFVKWDVLVPDPDRRALLQEHGVPAQEGNATFSRFQPVGPGNAFDVALELNGTWSLRGTAANPDASLAAFSFSEYTQTPHGLAVWTTNGTSESGASGAGVLTSTSGFFREVVGSDRAQAYYLAGTGGALVNGTLRLPPLPLE